MSDIAESNRQGGAQALAKSAQNTSPDDRPFAILRYAKLTSMAAIRGTAAHMRRTIPTPNADPALTPENRVLVGSDDPFADVLARLPEPDARGADGKLLRRSNSVLAVEVLMTTSPEWWRDASQAERTRWMGQSLAWLQHEWGAENVVHVEPHLDETTGHLTCLIVPIDPRTGRLNARAWIGGRASKNEPGTSRLSGHQTRYAEAVEDLGLRRGRTGSTATHTTLREYQRRAAVVLEQEVTAPQLGVPPLLGRAAWAAEKQAQIDAAVQAQAVGASEARTERGKALALGSQLDRQAIALEEARAARQALTDRLRAIPVARVLEDLGCDWDPHEKRWKLGAKGARSHKIEVDEGRNRWRCAITQAGGHGAIDVVKSVMETDFTGALSWLTSVYGQDAASADLTARLERGAKAEVQRATQERPPFTPPVPDPDAWPEVRAYLVGERGLDPDLVDAAHAAGDVYAQTKEGPKGGLLKNAIFLHRAPDGTPTGAEIKGLRKSRDGSRFSGLAAGSRKDMGAFRTGVELARARIVVVVEAAIDALSARMFAKMRGRDEGLCVISTAGNSKKGSGLPEPIRTAIPATAKRFAGQDRGKAGDRQARDLDRSDPGHTWTRWMPPEPHGDWNDWAQTYARERSTDSSGDRATPPAPETGDEPSGPEL